MLKQLLSFIIAFLQMVIVSVIPIDYSGDEVFPDEENPLTTEKVYTSREEAIQAGGGWYEVLVDDFDYASKEELEQVWDYAVHGNRNQEWWCPQAVSLRDHQAVIGAWLESDPAANCPGGSGTGSVDGKCAANTEHFHGYGDGGDYEVVTGGLCSKLYQAFGYFEVKVKVPRQNGMWSAFWLQSKSQGQIGNYGMDGTEVDVFESVFINEDQPNKIAHAFLWDGYGNCGRTHGQQIDMGKDMYDGWHTYGFLWTPEQYVFFVDGVATWKTVGGKISQVPAQVRLTNEVRKEGSTNTAWGVPQRVFDAMKDAPAEFLIDYVKIYQNTSYEPFIRTSDDFFDAGKLLLDSMK
ncbi:MAG TPA: glycoside hydrolase family 16 protein [Candidatus Fimivicinus intestinavium]|nr:glycoside hydrolase family 16 protein [Candidatus Fimivicinus intestinavium]